MKYSRFERTGLKVRTRQEYDSRLKSGMNRELVRLIVNLLIFTGIFWYLNYGALFIINSVKITADDYLPADKIAQAFQIDDLVGMNFLWLRYTDIANGIKANPAIESVSFSFWHPRELGIHLISAKPFAAISRARGYYIIGQNGQFLGFLPPTADVSVPVRLTSDRVLFNPESKPLRIPWRETLMAKELDNSTLMLALGYHDLIRLRHLVDNQPGFPPVQYVGYDEHYGLYLKCYRKPLVLLGYGDNLDIQLNKARKVLIYPDLLYDEDKYIDLRFDRFHSAKNLIPNLGKDNQLSY